MIESDVTNCERARREKGRTRVPKVISQILCASLLSVCVACGSEGAGTDRHGGSGGVASIGRGPVQLDATSLAHAAEGPNGDSYTIVEVDAPGFISGRVVGGSLRDTTIEPTLDQDVCSPYSESLVAGSDGGLSHAAVWLVGVSSGPRDETPKRVSLALSGCRFDPHIIQVAEGGTIMVNHKDAMMSRLKFRAVGESLDIGPVLLFSDAGQVVPTSNPTSSPGLLRVTDELHPWASAWVLVSPHPFAAITNADGSFRFEHVPPGKYDLVVWHEYLGVRHLPVRVDANVETTIEIDYGRK